MHHAAACDDAERKRCESAALADEQAETAAINDLQNVEWMGRAITVRKAEPRR